MILYHGSNTMINVIDLTKSKRYKDFGQAFYLSAEEEQDYDSYRGAISIYGRGDDC